MPELVARVLPPCGGACTGRDPARRRCCPAPCGSTRAGRTVERDGVEVTLTRTEFDLLVELARRPGQVFTRDLLLDRVWGYDYLGDSRLVDVAVGRLRAKVEADPSAPELVLTVRGAGYKAARPAG
jgi:two-component system response regulator MtrA